MNLPKHFNMLMASAVTFSVAISPLTITSAHAQSAPAAEAPGDSGWQKEFELWRTSNKGGTPSDYQTYLRVYPSGKFANVAKRRIEELNAATATVSDNDETAAVADEAAAKEPVKAAEVTVDNAKDVELWRQVSKTGKQADYEKYLKEFPQGKFAKVAKTRIENLLAKAAAPKDNTAQVEVAAKKVETPAVEPAAEDQAEADDQSAKDQVQADDSSTAPADDNHAVETAQNNEQPADTGNWEQEYALWKAASDGNTVNEYEAYLKAYPQGKFAAIAQARIIQLAAAETPDPTIAEGDDSQDDAAQPNKVVRQNTQNNNMQQQDDQAADDQSMQSDDQAQDESDQNNMQGDDQAAANDRMNKQNHSGQNMGQNQDQNEKYTEGSEDIEEAVLDRESRHEMQGRLSALGYDTRGTDGAFGPRTRDAIASWQQDNGAPVTGFLSEDQIDAIRVASAVSYTRWLATAVPIVVQRVRPRAEIVYIRPRNNVVVYKRRPAGVVVIKPYGFKNKARFHNRVKVKLRFNGGCRKKRRC